MKRSDTPGVRHLWLVDAKGRSTELLRFLRSCQSAYRADDPGWSPTIFCQAATYGFDHLVIAEVSTLHQIVGLCEIIERDGDRLHRAPNRLVVIAPIAPQIDLQIIGRAGFTIQHEHANAVRIGGDNHVAA